MKPLVKVLGRIVRGCSILLLILAVATLIYALYGRWDLSRTTAKLRERGDKLTVAELQSPALPPGGDFFDDPLWDEVRRRDASGEWTPVALDTLYIPLSDADRQALEQKFPMYGSIPKDESWLELAFEVQHQAEKSDDPAVRRCAVEFVRAISAPVEPFLPRIEEWSRRTGITSGRRDYSVRKQKTPYLILIKIQRVLQLRVWLSFQEKQPEVAVRNLQTMIRIAGLSQDSFLTDILLTTFLACTPGDGISAADYAALQSSFARLDALEVARIRLRDERASLGAVWPGKEELSGRKKPADETLASRIFAWFLRHVAQPADQARYHRLTQEALDRIPATPGQFVNGDDPVLGRDWPEAYEVPLGEGLFFPVSLSYGQRHERMIDWACWQEASIRQAQIVCALERYRIEHGTYPASLDELASLFPGPMPLDPTTGQPLKYRRDDPGRFTLWSVDWHGYGADGEPGLQVWGKIR